MNPRKGPGQELFRIQSGFCFLLASLRGIGMEKKSLCRIAFILSAIYFEILFGFLCYEAGWDQSFSKHYILIMIVALYFILALASYQFFQKSSPYEKTSLVLAIVYLLPLAIFYLVVFTQWIITKERPWILDPNALLWHLLNLVYQGSVSGLYFAAFFRVRKEAGR